MNILLINQHAGTPDYGMEFRPYYMGKEWSQRGHKVIIVAASFSHLRKKQPSSCSESIDGMKYSWVKVNSYNGNGIPRILAISRFVTKLYFYYKKYLGDFVPDIVIASSTHPLDIYPARRIAHHYGAKLIYEVHDLWPLTPMEIGGYSPKHPFIRVMQNAENKCYQSADAVVSMLPNAESHMREHGLTAGKFNYIPNGIVTEDWENSCNSLPKQHEELFNHLKEENKFIVGFAGNHGIANSLYAAIDAVAPLACKDIVFVLTGTGPEKEKLIAYTEKNKISNVFFLPAVEKRYIPSLLSQMDVLYIGLQRESLFRFGISPNKLFDYMMAGKPVVQAIDAGNNIVGDAGCGLCAEPDNSKEIGQAILTLKEILPEERKKMGENGRSYVLKNHTYSVLAEKFINVMKKVLGE